MAQMTVAVVASDSGTGKCLVRDTWGNEFEVDASVRVSGAGFPAEGERWLLEKSRGTWVFGSLEVPIKVVENWANTTGLHPVERQMLAALHAHGLLYDRMGLDCDG